MSNMSYCRFQNTASDLDDCKEALMRLLDREPGSKLSNDEVEAARCLVTSCAEIIALFATQGGRTRLDVDKLMLPVSPFSKLIDAVLDEAQTGVAE